MKYFEFIDKYSLQLNQHQLDKSILYQLIYARDPQIKNLSDLANYFKNDVPPGVQTHIIEDLNQLINNHKPLAYILGYTWFLGQKFFVNDNVFSPRPETEYWTDYIISVLESYPKLKILDLCCGTGVIGLSIKKQLPIMDVYLSDISPLATQNTIQNAKQLNIKVTVVESDLFNEFNTMKFDVIICNPPYIDPAIKLDSSLAYEPQNALYADDHGLIFYEKILKVFRNFANLRYLLVFEIGFDQADTLKNLIFETLGDKTNLQIIKDQYNHDRVIIINGMQ